VFSQGSLQRTEGPLDVAINGNGFFQIQMPDGTLAYTRDGSFQLDNTGQVVTSSGYPLSPSITLPSTAINVSISRDGIVSYTQAGSTTPTQAGTIQLASFINNGGLQSVGENLFIETAASGTPTPNTPGSNGVGLLNQYYVETSNVNVAEELVTMIQTQRAYEMNSKVVSTSDAMLGRLTQL
jgi:flagellar basal-body rod protein FlgG